MIRTASIACLALALLSGCGFHLRGAGDVPALDLKAGRVQVSETRAAGIAAEVRSRLEMAGVDANSAAEPRYFIQLDNERIDRDVLTVSPRTGKVEEYQLNFLVYLTVADAGGKRLLENVPIALSREYTFDPDGVLGKFSEEETLRTELTRAAADQVLRRVRAVIAAD
jgi:LPS-assembly lipoprotein